MNEPMPMPEPPEEGILSCENCSNLIHLRKQAKEEVVSCPICGCLNSIVDEPEDVEMMDGHLIISSPNLSIKKADVLSGQVAVPQLPEKVQAALIWLQEHQWRIGFVPDSQDKSNFPFKFPE